MYSRNRLSLFTLALIACGTATNGGNNTGAGSSAGNGSNPKSAATIKPCKVTITISDGTSASFSSCDFDTELFFLKSTTQPNMPADNSRYTTFGAKDMSANLSAVLLDFKLPDLPTTRTYGHADLVSGNISIQTTDPIANPFGATVSTPAGASDQGDITLTLSSVRTDASNISYVHGTIDATVPTVQALNPSQTARTATLHVDF